MTQDNVQPPYTPAKPWRGTLIRYGLTFAAGIAAMAWAGGWFAPKEPAPANAVAPIDVAKPMQSAWLVPGNAAHGQLAAVRANLLNGQRDANLLEQFRLAYQAGQPTDVGTVLSAFQTPVSAKNISDEIESLGSAWQGNDPDASFIDRLSWFFSNLALFRDANQPSPISSRARDQARFLVEQGQADEALKILRAQAGAGLKGPAALIAKLEVQSKALAAIDRLASVVAAPAASATAAPSAFAPPVQLLPPAVPPSVFQPAVRVLSSNQ